jgi:hypothetical protein
VTVLGCGDHFGGNHRPEPTLTTVNCGEGGGHSALRRDWVGCPDHSRPRGPAARHASTFGVFPNREPHRQTRRTLRPTAHHSNLGRAAIEFADDLGGQLEWPLPSPNW